MKFQILFFYTIFIVNCMYGQHEKDYVSDSIFGIGAVEISYSNNNLNEIVTEFYTNCSDTVPQKTIKGRAEAYYHQDSLKWKSLKRYIHGNIHFRCIAEQDSFYRVIVNPETHETYWVKKKKNIRLLSWPEFIRSSIAIRLNYGDKVFLSPNKKSKKIAKVGLCDIFNIEQVYNEWICISEINWCDIVYDIESENPITNAWVKWTDGKEILVTLWNSE